MMKSTKRLQCPEANNFTYVAFGLTLQSDFPIPELPVAQQLVPDPVILRLQSDDVRNHIPEELLAQPIGFQINSDSAVVYLKDVGVFLLQRGTRVTVIPCPQAPFLQVRQAVMGIVMALVLHQRGYLLLHGSAVSIEGRAIIFLGDSGAGKSSMAAALYAQGYPLLTDDLTAISLAEEARVAIAGTPIKLNPKMAEFLQIEAPSQQLPVQKNLYQIDVPTALNSQPLHAIFRLESAPQFVIESLPLQQAVTELMRFSGLKSILPIRDAAHFSQCAALAKVAPFSVLKRPKDLAQLPTIAAKIAQSVVDGC